MYQRAWHGLKIVQQETHDKGDSCGFFLKLTICVCVCVCVYTTDAQRSCFALAYNYIELFIPDSLKFLIV